MKKSLKLLSVALASVYLAGCSTYSVNNYGISASNVEQLKKFDGVQVSVNDFTASKPGLSKIQCRGAGPVAVSDGTTFESYIKAIVGAEYILRWLPIGTHDWQKFLTPAEIEEKFNKLNLDKLELMGLKFNIFSNNWTKSKDCSVNYILLAKKN